MQKQYRLKGERNFRVVFKKGVSCSTRHLVLLSLKSKYPRSVKFGLTVGKKVGNAVKRNLVKRRLRSIITDLLPGVCPGYSYVIVAKSGVDAIPYAELYEECANLFGRVKKS